MPVKEVPGPGTDPPGPRQISSATGSLFLRPFNLLLLAEAQLAVGAVR